MLKRIHNGGPASIQVVPTGSQPKMMRLRREMAQNDRTKTGFRVGYSETFFSKMRVYGYGMCYEICCVSNMIQSMWYVRGRQILQDKTFRVSQRCETEIANPAYGVCWIFFSRPTPPDVMILSNDHELFIIS